MPTVKFLQDITVYNSITAVSGVTVNDLTVIGTSNIPDVSTLKSASASWDSVYTTVNTNSGDWGSSYNTLNALSAAWSDTTSVVVANSASWDTVYATVNATSGEWGSSYTLLGESSGRWESTYSTVTANSARWESVYTTVQASSANPVVETLTVTVSATLASVGIGTTVPDTTKALHVVGDVLVYGNLSANGSMTFTNTLFNTTSALSVLNTGTGPALVVNQTGDQAVAAFYDDANIALWVDGDALRPGYVGIGTKTPNKALTVVGDISATGTIYGGNTINKFVSAFGDGVAQSFVISHNLGSRNVIPSVMDNATYEIVVPSLVLTTTNTITIETATVPGSAAYTLTVIG